MEDRQYPKGKRVLCYIIDLGIIFTISLLLVKFAVKPILGFNEDNYTIVKENILDDFSKMIEGKEVSNELLEYDLKIFFRYYLVDSVSMLITFFFISFIYLVLIPILANKKTLGRLITKLKIIKLNGEEVTNSTIIKRELIATYLFHFLTYALIFGLLFSIISLFVCIASGRSIVDRLSKTALVDENYNEDNNVIDVKVEEHKDDNYNNYYNNENNNISNESHEENHYNNNEDNNKWDNQDDDDDEYKVF
jgi:uncharacterized RDD family membrane protein YckC